MSEYLYGRNAVRETLRARRRHIHKLILADNLEKSAVLNDILTLAGRIGLRPTRWSRKKINSIARGTQGVVLEVGRYPTVELEDVLGHAKKLKNEPFILILDHIEDPHNVGAILRTAEIVGVHGVILPKQRAAQITPTVANVSAGATEHMRIVQTANLVQSLKKLKKQNIWVSGVEHAPNAIFFHQANLGGAIALVIGSEGKGMSRLVQQTCDFLIKIPMQGQVNSLNASVAGGLALYEVWRARGFAPNKSE
ncbi:23S rRNA (guanosine(2251)-2'-O)-methyltransferase RlmB [Anaerolineales bacterium HSG24]|nr:23S rRNA (guanosine(2251)-2'-O)-methyltransferase RlmB [Anaerolineales bacterium HSG24]